MPTDLGARVAASSQEAVPVTGMDIKSRRAVLRALLALVSSAPGALVSTSVHSPDQFNARRAGTGSMPSIAHVSR